MRNNNKMLPSLKKVGADQHMIFHYMKVKEPHFYALWHYHPQCEIMIIEKSSGAQYVGDNIDSFDEGDVLVFGADIPHLLRNHAEYFSGNEEKTAEATVLYFNPEFVGKEFMELPEMTAVREFLHTAKRGIRFSADDRKKVAKRIYGVLKKKGLNSLLEFISTLHYMATSAEYTTLSSVGFTSVFDDEDVDRLNKISDFLMNNFGRNIKLDEVASLANMSPTAFCRYFKARTNKTFVSFLNEIRIGNACKYLIENRSMTISQICFESGFNNLTNFNIQFKKLKGVSPQEFRGMYKTR